MVDMAALKIANAKRWAVAKPTRNFATVAKYLTDNVAKPQYLAVEKLTGVPWAIIAVIHEREASQRWDANLAQGDRYDQVSTHEPKGRGPFKSWQDAALDALTNCSPYAARNRDWSIGGALTLLEEYNGLGYAARGLPSPYLWSGTDQYKTGKFIADGRFDATVIDQQLGCAGLLMAMMKIDPTITFTGVTLTPVAPKPAIPPLVPQPAKASEWAQIIAALSAIFIHRKGTTT
jgi:lysozyme family protein